MKFVRGLLGISVDRRQNNIKNILRGIICGFAHSGTTLVLQLMLQNPNVEAGFEVGALLHNSPKEFFRDNGRMNEWISQGLLKAGWKLSDSAWEQVKTAETFNDLYTLLLENSPLCNNKNAWIIDKTPRYQQKLSDILARVSVPAIVTLKDPRLLYYSHLTHDGLINVDKFSSFYKHRMRATERAKRKFPDRVLVIRFEEFVQAYEKFLLKCFELFDLEPVLREEFNNDWPTKVSGNKVDPTEVPQRFNVVPVDIRQRIEQVLPEYCYLEGVWELGGIESS